MAAGLLAAFEALRRGDPEGALAALDAAGLCADALVEADRRGDAPGTRARAWSYRAQALRALARVEEADRALVAAIRAAKQAGDAAGVAQLRELQASVVASLAAERIAQAERTKDAHLADTPDDVLLAGATDGVERAARHLRKCEALRASGRLTDAAAQAERGAAEADRAGATRESVLTRLALVTLRPEAVTAHLHAAHAIADAADDTNLIAAVAQAARASGVRLPAPGF